MQLINQCRFCLLLCVLVILSVAILVYALTPMPNERPNGIYLPIQSDLPPLANQDVELLTTEPGSFKPMGRINIEMHVNNQRSVSEVEKKVLQQAKILAAAHGANSIIVQRMGQTITHQEGLGVFLFNGLAITL